MEKQPDKFEVLMDWFLGDAKEITASQKEMTEILSALSEKLAKDTESLGETADSLKRTLVENQRSISLAISDDAKAREEFLTKFRRAQASRAETLTRQILFITALTAEDPEEFKARAKQTTDADERKKLARRYTYMKQANSC
ncbi:plasmid stabilization protein StbC (plasmid) [Escherichia coli]|nr:plasmid stabilization protein StbC [Escherichia coli]